MVKNYFKLVTGLDDAAGRIFQAPGQKGMAENTVIIFTGDNGYYLGAWGLADKWYSQNESIRIPLIIYDPRIPELNGKRINEIAQNIDLAPTILSLANVSIPGSMEGRSLLPLLHGKSENWRSDFFFEHWFKGWNIPESEGVVSLNYKFIRYVKEEPVYEYLYNLKKDPGVINNYIDSTGYAEITEGFKSGYTEFLNTIGR